MTRFHVAPTVARIGGRVRSRPAAGRLAGLVLGGLLAIPPSLAGDLTQATVAYADQRFTVHTELMVHAPAERVRTVLSQPDNLPRLNPAIEEVVILAQTATNQRRMRITSRVCISLICLRYRWVQEARTLSSGDIVTHFDPAASDFREGWVRYRLLPAGGHTRLLMDAELVPDFWFPPLLGPALIKHALRTEALATAAGIERLVAEQPLLAQREIPAP